MGDEREQSKGEFNAAGMLKLFTQLKGSLERVRVYGALAAREAKCLTGFTYKNSEFEKLINGTKGSMFPLCTTEFGKNLAAVSKEIITAATLTLNIPLPSVPDPLTIRVTHKGKVLPQGDKASGGVWTYDMTKNAVVIHNSDFAVGLKEEVKIEYQIEIP